MGRTLELETLRQRDSGRPPQSGIRGPRRRSFPHLPPPFPSLPSSSRLTARSSRNPPRPCHVERTAPVVVAGKLSPLSSTPPARANRARLHLPTDPDPSACARDWAHSRVVAVRSWPYGRAQPSARLPPPSLSVPSVSGMVRETSNARDGARRYRLVEHDADFPVFGSSSGASGVCSGVRAACRLTHERRAREAGALRGEESGGHVGCHKGRRHESASSAPA